MAEYRDGKIFIADRECKPRKSVPGRIADFFLVFQQLDWESKELVLRNADYDEVLDSAYGSTELMTSEEYGRHLDRALFIAMLDNERTIKILDDMEDALSRMPETE